VLCRPDAFLKNLSFTLFVVGSVSSNHPANSIFLSQQTSTNQPKPAQKPTSEQAEWYQKVV